MSEQGKHRDDLTAVKGIGRVRQKWLRDSFDINTFQDLADLSVAEIEGKLKSEGKSLSQKDIKNWIEQAATLALAIPNPPAQVEPQEKVVKLAEKKVEDSWKPVASFVVEFQSRKSKNQVNEQRTSVHFMEADTTMTWPGIENKELCRWMAQQANIEEPTPVKETAQEEVASAKAVQLKATQVRLAQRPDYAMTLDMGSQERPFLGHVNHENPISLEIDFELTDPVETNGSPLPREYRTHCHIRNVAAGTKINYLDMTSEEGDEIRPFYRAKLTDVSLKPGMYELGILVKGVNPLSTNYVKLPKLNVL